MRNYLGRLKKKLGLNQFGKPIIILSILLIIIAGVYYSQQLSEATSLPPIVSTSPKEQYEIAKLAAEIRQIRSDTSGSLFWLKMIALFVTVGGAVGGYLVGQENATKKRLEFENLKNIDSIYQGIVLELADEDNPLRRAAAAVRLGMILKSFPTEWVVDDERKKQMVQLTKQVLAASLAIEDKERVLKTLSSALILHRRFEKKRYANLRELDLSMAKAANAFWARANFFGADFYHADLEGASFRWSILRKAQFRNTNLRRAVLANADCHGAIFKLADLRNAVLTNAKLQGAKFEGARVFGCKLKGAKWGDNAVDDPEAVVNVSEADDGKETMPLSIWLAQQTGHHKGK